MPMYDFRCGKCGNLFEDLVSSDTKVVECWMCGDPAERLPCAPNLGFLESDPQRKKEALAKRSYDHSMKEAKKNAEQIASKMGGVAKPQSPWNIRSTKKK